MASENKLILAKKLASPSELSAFIRVHLRFPTLFTVPAVLCSLIAGCVQTNPALRPGQPMLSTGQFCELILRKDDLGPLTPNPSHDPLPLKTDGGDVVLRGTYISADEHWIAVDVPSSDGTAIVHVHVPRERVIAVVEMPAK